MSVQRSTEYRVHMHRVSQLLPLNVLAASIFLAAAIFSFDLLVPLGVAAGVPYAGVVLLGLYSQWPPILFLLAAVGSALTVLGYFLSVPEGALWVVLSNRGLALSVLI